MNRNSEEDPLKLLKPAAGLIYDLLEKSGKAEILGTGATFEKLNPGTDPKKAARENGVRIISYALLVLIATVILSIVCLVTQENPLTPGKGIKRGTVGEGTKEYELDVSSEFGSDRQKVVVSVNERKCPDEELDTYLENMCEKLIQEVLNGNPSAEEVRSDIRFVKEIPGTAVKVKFDDPDFRYIFSDGTIRFDKISEPVFLTLSAELTYFDEVRYCSFPIRILPAEESGDSFPESLEKLLKEKDEESQDKEYMELPDRMDGKPLFFSVHRSGTPGVVAAGGLIAVLAMIPAMAADTKKRCKEREIQMNRDYNDIISKLSLLLTAGMTCRSAWEKIVSDYLEQKESLLSKNTKKKKTEAGKEKECRFAYEEMATAMAQMRMGKPEGAAYEEFGLRCGVITYQRLGSLLAKNLKRGSREITRLLEVEAQDAFEERRQSVRQKGEEVGTRLLFPMFGMFGIVIAIVVVPAFSSMGM
ncbi:MAG: hypothetical protein K6G81_03345 [Lachnospiraceae bacterium]|nr:hypothetical protein [Lachnospiraceae bacterium]